MLLRKSPDGFKSPFRRWAAAALFLLFFPFTFLPVSTIRPEQESSPSTLQNFLAFASGRTGDVKISIKLRRESEVVKGSGRLIVGSKRYDLVVTDAALSIDPSVNTVNSNSLIPVTNKHFGKAKMCSPSFVELNVTLLPNNEKATLRLNECEPSNTKKFKHYNPCAKTEGNDLSIEGACIDPNRKEDTAVLQFKGDDVGICNGNCTVFTDVVVVVPSLQSPFFE